MRHLPTYTMFLVVFCLSMFNRSFAGPENYIFVNDSDFLTLYITGHLTFFYEKEGSFTCCATQMVNVTIDPNETYEYKAIDAINQLKLQPLTSGKDITVQFTVDQVKTVNRIDKAEIKSDFYVEALCTTAFGKLGLHNIKNVVLRFKTYSRSQTEEGVFVTVMVKETVPTYMGISGDYSTSGQTVAPNYNA